MTAPVHGPVADCGPRLAVGLVRAVRGAGVAVPTASAVLLAEALAVTGIDDRDLLFRTARAVCCTEPGQFPAFAEGFARAFGEPGSDDGSAGSAAALAVAVENDAGESDAGEEAPAAGDGTPAVRWSRAEVLRARDFAEYTDEEFADARRLMARMRPIGPRRRSRRLTPTNRVTRHPDLRRTARRALRTGGDAVVPAHRRRASRPRRIVLLLDVSGSMEPYARVYVRFLQAVVAGRGEVEAFAIGTRLTRLTRELAGRDPDQAVRAAALRVVDWSGGTRLGDGLREFNDRWGVGGLARGAVIVVVSDGWDRGDPGRLGAEVERLGRVAYRIIWVNPLVATPGFAPLAGGMAAALPHVDALVEGHSLEALDRVITEIDP